MTDNTNAARCSACGSADGFCSWSCSAQRGCDACGAGPGSECRPDCLGMAQELERERLCELSYERAVRAHTDGLIGRLMTVEASKLYALVSFRAELDA